MIELFELALAKDSARTRVYHFTRLGLIQVTRKRTSESNESHMTETCSYCSGSGITLSRESVAFNILRDIQKQVKLYGLHDITVEAHPDTTFTLKQQLHEHFKKLTTDLGASITIKPNKDFHREHFSVYATTVSGGR